MKVAFAFFVFAVVAASTIAGAVVSTAITSDEIIEITACVNLQWSCHTNCTVFSVKPDTCFGTDGYGSLDFRCYTNETYKTIDTIMFEGTECNTHVNNQGNQALPCGQCVYGGDVHTQTYTCGKEQLTVNNCKGDCNKEGTNATDCSMLLTAPYGSCTPVSFPGSSAKASFLVAPNFKTVIPIRFQALYFTNNCSSDTPWNLYDPDTCMASFPSGGQPTQWASVYNFKLKCVSSRTEAGEAVKTTALPADLAANLKKALAAKPRDGKKRVGV